MIVVYSAPATEPLSVAEVKAHLRLDESNQEPAPGAITVALASPAVAGNVTAGTHRVLATFVTADGETQAGETSAAVTVVDAAVNGKLALSNIPIGGALVTARKLYMTAAGGSTYLYAATVANNTDTAATLNIADASLGAQAPTINTTNDPLLGVFIAAARAAAEVELHRYLITQTLDAYFDDFPRYSNPRFPDRTFRLPPLQLVTAITYVATDGTTQTLAADQYLVDAVSQPARISEVYGVSWPPARIQENAVKVRFVAGYGAASAVPACIKQWMLMKIATAWDFRAALVAGERGFSELPSEFFDGLLDSERVTGRI